ncbi:hypothetical protein Bca4012_029514 [Brassica carinata]
MFVFNNLHLRFRFRRRTPTKKKPNFLFPISKINTETTIGTVYQALTNAHKIQANQALRKCSRYKKNGKPTSIAPFGNCRTCGRRSQLPKRPPQTTTNNR